MRFSDFFQKGIRTRPYWVSFKGMGAEFAQESTLYKAIFVLLALPLAMPLLSTAILAFRVFTSSRVDFPVFLKTIIFQIIVEFCLILYAILLARDKNHAPFFTKTHVLLIVLGAALAIAGLFSSDAHVSFFSGAFRADGLIFLFHVGIYFFLLTWLIYDRIRLELLFKIAIVCGIAAIFFIIFVYFSQAEQGLGLAWRQIIQIILGNTGFFAHYLLILTLINTYFLLIKPRIWNLAAAILFALFALITLSSTAAFLICCLYAVFLWYAWRAGFYACAFAGLGIMFFAVMFGDSFIAQIISPVSETFVRGQVWKDAIWSVFTHNPFLGYGWGNNELMWNALAHDFWSVSGDPWNPIFFDKTHNILIEFLTAGGIIGLVGFIVFWARIFWICRRRLFFLTVFGLNLIYLMFNFDTLMSYVLISVVLAGFVLFAKERRYEFQEQPRVRGAVLARWLIAGACVLVGSFTLYQYNFKPLEVQFLTYQAEAKMLSSAGAPFLKKHDVLASLEQARGIEQPYNLLLLDVAEILTQLPEHISLDAEEKNQVYERSRSIYAGLNEKHPVNPYYYYKRGAMEKNMVFNLEAAEKYLKKTLELSPRKGVFRFYLAVVYLQQDKTGEAVKIFEQLSKEGLYPGTVDAFLALIDIQRGQLKQGQKKFTAALLLHKPVSLEWDLLTGFYLVHSDKQSLLDWYARLSGIVEEDSYLNTIIARIKT